MSEKGISLVALIVTIIIIIILATIGGFYSNEILEKSERMRTESELRNIDELVSNQKARIMAGEIEIPTTYIATTSDINKYSGIDTEKLSNSDIQKIKNVNNDSSLSAEYKYHLMNQAAFNDLFAGDINVKDVKYVYLINFDKKVIILNASGKLYVVGEIE